MKRTKLTPKQVTAKRIAASKYSEDELQVFSKADVYNLVKGCLPKTSSMNKEQLIEAILEWTKLDRRKAEMKVSEGELALKAIEMFDGTNDYERLANLWYTAYSGDTNAAANAIVKYLQNFVDSNSKAAVSVINNDYAEIRNILNSWFNTARDDWARSVASKIHEKTKDLRALVMSEYTTRKQDKSHLANVDRGTLIEECRGILEEPNKFTWEWVSFALALTSGRRATEIHGENRHYEQGSNILTIAERDGSHLIAEYKYSPTLAFTGAAKVKGRDVGTIQVPLLVDSKLWLDNWNNLPSERKNRDSKAMKSISRALSEKLKEPLKLRGLVMYKDSRDVYVDSVLERYDEANFKFVNRDSKGKEISSEGLRSLFASSVLNHKIEAGSTRSYGSN